MKSTGRHTGEGRHPEHPMRWTPAFAGVTALVILLFALFLQSHAVEIPLESLTPARIGYIDLQKVFDIYPEKAFAEGDLLREIEKRKRELGQKQTLIATIRQQIASDQTALDQGKTGAAIVVPTNTVPDLTPVVAPPAPVVAAPRASTSTVSNSTSSAAAVEPYPTEDPLAGLPGHDSGAAVEHAQSAGALPGMTGPLKKVSVLDLLAATTGPVLLNAEAQTALQKRIDDNKRLLERQIAEFRNFRVNAIADMKVLQTEKTYDVMSKIYAVLQTLARDEGVTIVLDKAYVLYGEDTVDLSDKLIQRLQQESQ